MNGQQTAWVIDRPESIRVDGVGKVRVMIVTGEVDVVTGTGDQTVVEVAELQGSAPLHVEVVDGVLTIAHEKLSWGGLLSGLVGRTRRYAVVSISVPRGAAVDIGVVAAHATVTGVTGVTTVKSVSGDVTLDGCTGEIRAETVSGRLDTRGLVGTLSFKSVSGALAVIAAQPTSVNARTISGDVLLDVDGVVESIDATSVTGDVTVRLPENAALDVDVRATSGRVASVFPGLVVSKSPGSARLTGSIGAGGGRFTAQTVSGDVSILAAAGGPS